MDPPTWVIGLSSLGLDAFAGQIKFLRLCYKKLTALESRQHFNRGSRGFSKRDVAQACNVVLVQHKDALQLTALDNRAARNQQRLPITTRELHAPEEARAQPGVGW